MPDIKTPKPPVTKPKRKIEKASALKLLSEVKLESQVVVHCTCVGGFWGSKIRIWKSTFLFANDSEHKSALVSNENITLYPRWTTVGIGATHTFTLVFQGLPKDCKSFDLIEKIPQPGGFECRNIRRNKRDVYFVDLEV